MPAAAARMIAIFIFFIRFSLVSNLGGLRRLNYLVAGTSSGGATGATGAFEQQDALTITPHAAAAITIILTSFI